MKRKDKREMIKLCGDGKKKFICPSLSKATRLYCSKSITSLELLEEKKGRYDSPARANAAQLPSSFRASISDL